MIKPLDEYLIQRIRRLSSPLEPIPTEAAEEAAPLTGVRAVLFDVYGTLFISGAGEIGVNEPLESDSAFSESIQAAGFNWLVQEAPVRGSERLKHHIRETHARKKAQGIEFPEVDILEEWDHRTLIPGKNPNIKLEEIGEDICIRFAGKEYMLPKADVCILPTPNITVEELARLLTTRIAKNLSQRNIKRIKCSVSEYEGQGASFELKLGSSNNTP